MQAETSKAIPCWEGDTLPTTAAEISAAQNLQSHLRPWKFIGGPKTGPKFIARHFESYDTI